MSLSLIVLLMESLLLLILFAACFHLKISVFIPLCSSLQTLGSTHVWPPAPVAKHHGVPSWKSKVGRGKMT